MEIGALSDYDDKYLTNSELQTGSWNACDVRSVSVLKSRLNGIIGQVFQGEKAWPLGRVARLETEATYTSVRNLAHLYLAQKQTRKETVAPCGNAITSSISLNQLLSPSYLNQEILQIPFTLPADLADLPPFFELLEGIGLEIFNSVSLPNFSIYPPAWDPQFIQYYQSLAEYNETPVKELAQATLIAVAQAIDSSNALQESQLIVAAAEQARAAALVIAQAKANIAATEHAKAVEAAIKVQDAAAPPHKPQSGFAREPFSVTYERWLANKTTVTVAAVEQAKIAAAAIEEAQSAAAIAVAQTQAVATAVKQVYLAVEAATQAQVAVSILQAAPFLSQTAYPEVELETVYGKEYVSKLYLQFGLPDPFALNIDISQCTPMQEKSLLPFPPLFQDFTEPSYPKFTQKFEEKPAETHRLSDDEALALQSIELYFAARNTQPSIGPFVNYASTLSSAKPSGPFRDVPLLGYLDQSTIHFHCGIRNDFSSVVEAGLCLNSSLDRRFAVQPHLIHSNNVVKGVLFVLFEKTKATVEELKAAGVPLDPTIASGLPEFTLEHSHIQQSIAYEVENLTRIAQNIIATGNPNLKQVHVTFSNGGYVVKEALKLLPPEYRDTIIVITAGSTAIIENNLAHKVYNLIGDKDFASQVCNGGMAGIEAAKQNGAIIEIIPQTETQTGVGGHYFMQPEYQKEISEYIKNSVRVDCEIY